MDELEKLEHLSLVSKICTELDNNLGINDKDLAEFIIDLAETNKTFNDFKKALIENGAEFPDSFITNLLRIIQLMKKPKKSDSGNLTDNQVNADVLAVKFPGLAMPNKAQEEMIEPTDEKEQKEDKKEKKMKGESSVDDMMAELEAFAPSTSKQGTDDKKKVEKRERSRDRKRRSASRDRKPNRNSSRERKRSRSRSRDRRRSRDRKARSK